jgi:hypothetical protein
MTYVIVYTIIGMFYGVGVWAYQDSDLDFNRIENISDLLDSLGSFGIVLLLSSIVWFPHLMYMLYYLFKTLTMKRNTK